MYFKVIKVCSQPLILQLNITFKQPLNKDKFPEICTKKANAVSVHKREDKMLAKIVSSY